MEVISEKRQKMKASIQSNIKPASGEEYKQTELGFLPTSWHIENLGSCLLSTPEYGINAPAVEYSDKLPTYIRITDITEEGKFCPEKKMSVMVNSSKNYSLQIGDLVFARTGASTGKTYLYNPSDGELTFAGFLIRVQVDSTKLIPGYLANYTKTCAYKNWVKVMSMRSGQPGINGKEYAQLPIPLPPSPNKKPLPKP